jgi:cation transport regulator ChaC
MAESVRYLPGWRLAFNKHSVDRKGDAASVERCASEMAWGFVYRVSDEDKESLLRREGGYKEHRLTVLCVEDVEDCQACTPQKVFTFVGEVACGNACGAPDEYLQLVLEGAKSRGIPEEYIQRIKEIARS